MILSSCQQSLFVPLEFGNRRQLLFRGGLTGSRLGSGIKKVDNIVGELRMIYDASCLYDILSPLAHLLLAREGKMKKTSELEVPAEKES